MSRTVRIALVAGALTLAGVVPALAQVDVNLGSLTPDNVKGYLAPLPKALSVTLNSAAFQTANVPMAGLNFSIGIHVMAMAFKDDDRTYSPTDPPGFTSTAPVDAPTVVGDEQAVTQPGQGGLTQVYPGGLDLKRGPTASFVELAQSLLASAEDTLVLVAGPDEGDLVRSFAPLAAGGRVKTWPVGSFLVLGGMLRRARLFVGSDSGVAHLAAAVGTPTVTLFGPARVQHWEPRSVRGAVISRDERCSYPCWPAVYDEPCSHHRCLRLVTVDEVRAAALTQLGAGKAS